MRERRGSDRQSGQQSRGSNMCCALKVNVLKLQRDKIRENNVQVRLQNLKSKHKSVSLRNKTDSNVFLVNKENEPIHGFPECCDLRYVSIGLHLHIDLHAFSPVNHDPCVLKHQQSGPGSSQTLRTTPTNLSKI